MDEQAFDQIRQLAASHYLVRCLHVAAELGVADAVPERGGQISDIADTVGANPDALMRILRLLASRNIFRVDDKRVSHTPQSRLLRTDHPQSLGSFVRMFGQSIQWQFAGDLKHAVVTGESVASRVAPNGGLWGYFSSHPAEGRVFGDAMAAKSAVQIADILDAYDFSAHGHVADIGGGHGHLLRAILERHTGVSGTLFDLPAVIDEARQTGSNERLSFVPGDFFTTPLPAADLTVLMEVLHDWDDAHCGEILSALRRSGCAKLLIIEIEMPDGPGPSWAKLLDIVMLAAFAARQRTTAENGRLLETSGYRVIRELSTPAGMAVLEAVSIDHPGPSAARL